MKNKEIYEDILTFWFGDIRNGMSAPEKKQLWYQSSEATDQLIIKKYSELLEHAAEGKLDSWQSENRSSLALILILDQFSRNIFRGHAEAFSFDEQALKICLNGLDVGHDKSVSLVERHFYYHPLMHAERLEHQQRCVALFQEMLQECNELNHEMFANGLSFAEQHRDIIAEFGRFPYRNEVLGRQSSHAEVAYLSRGGSRFGQ